MLQHNCMCHWPLHCIICSANSAPQQLLHCNICTVHCTATIAQTNKQANVTTHFGAHSRPLAVLTPFHMIIKRNIWLQNRSWPAIKICWLHFMIYGSSWKRRSADLNFNQAGVCHWSNFMRASSQKLFHQNPVSTCAHLIKLHKPAPTMFHNIVGFQQSTTSLLSICKWGHKLQPNLSPCFACVCSNIMNKSILVIFDAHGNKEVFNFFSNTKDRGM